MDGLQLGEPVLVAADQQEPVASRGQPGDDRATQAAGGAGDEQDLPAHRTGSATRVVTCSMRALTKKARAPSGVLMSLGVAR
ncbi:hypothetical protein GCM10020219_053780 [Nonomuraea dietziae]